MNILILCNNFHPFLGGLEQFNLSLAIKLINKKHKVSVATLNSENVSKFEVYKKISIFRNDSFNLLKGVLSSPTLNGILQLNRLKKNNFDLVITNTRFFPTSVLGALIAKWWHVKHIHIEHGNTYVQHPKKIVEIAAWTWDQTLGRLVFKLANHTIGISTPCQQFATKLGAKKTSVIYNSVKQEFLDPIKNKQNILTITYVGRLIQAKGVQDLITATNNTECVLNIIGDGPYKKILEQQAKQNNKTKIIFHGQQTQKQIKTTLKKTDIFINPSYSEGLPTSVLEACATATPTIATNVGGTSEIITHKYNGLLIEPKDINKMKEYIQLLDPHHNKHFHKKIAKNAYHTIKQNFTWKTNTKKFINLFHKITNGN